MQNIEIPFDIKLWESPRTQDDFIEAPTPHVNFKSVIVIEKLIHIQKISVNFRINNGFDSSRPGETKLILEPNKKNSKYSNIELNACWIRKCNISSSLEICFQLYLDAALYVETIVLPRSVTFEFLSQYYKSEQILNGHAKYNSAHLLITCNIPYYSTEQLVAIPSITPTLDSFTQCTNSDQSNSGNRNQFEINCSRCKQTLTAHPAIIRSCQVLPSGQFDNLWHEFRCCVEMPLHPTSNEDIYPDKDRLFMHPLYASVHPDSLEPHRLIFESSPSGSSSSPVTPTMLEIWSDGDPATLATSINPCVNYKTAPITRKNLEFSQLTGHVLGVTENDSQPIVKCSQCRAALGYARRNRLNTCCTVASSSINSRRGNAGLLNNVLNSMSSSSDDTNLSRYNEVKFVSHRISLVNYVGSSSPAPSLYKYEQSLENFIAYYITQFYRNYEIAQFLFFDTHSDVTLLTPPNVVILRVVNTDFNMYIECRESRTYLNKPRKQALKAELQSESKSEDSVRAESANTILASTCTKLESNTVTNHRVVSPAVVVNFKSGLKLSYKTQSSSEIEYLRKSGNARYGSTAKLPLDSGDFTFLQDLLIARAEVLCSSVFPNESLTFLLY